MANSVNTQIMLDGPRNFTMRVTGVLDTSDLAQAVLVDVATLNYPPGQLALWGIEWAVEDTLAVNLLWDATTPVLLDTLTGRGKREKLERVGGIVNNAGAGKTGNVLYSTQGWATGAILSFDVVLKFTKTHTVW